MPTILLSGPASTDAQVRTALASAGYAVASHRDDWGHPAGHEVTWAGEVYEADEECRCHGACGASWVAVEDPDLPLYCSAHDAFEVADETGTFTSDHDHYEGECTWEPRRTKNVRTHAEGDLVMGSGSFEVAEPGQPIVFVTAEGTDVDRAVAVVSPLHWRLRSHWEPAETEATLVPPAQLPPQVEGRLSALEAGLRALVGGEG